MSEPQVHDLHDFMQQISAEMAAEYQRIQKRARDDPGTAGDQGEENWAELLREWLPPTYTVETKGRIIGHEGKSSRQVDLVVLKGEYPKKLLTKKLYLAAGVAAAFECKTTLKANDIAEAFERCASVKALYPMRTGTPYLELHSPVIYGVLAHSHSWKGQESTQVENIVQKLHAADAAHVAHPRFQLDLLCAADLATWYALKLSLGRSQLGPGTCYVGYTGSGSSLPYVTPVGAMISNLLRKLAWESPSLRDLADYFRSVNVSGEGGGAVRAWPSSIYTADVQRDAMARSMSGGAWNAWSVML